MIKKVRPMESRVKKLILLISVCCILGLSIINYFNLPKIKLEEDFENDDLPLSTSDEYIVPQTISDHLWSPDGNKLAYIKPPPGEAWNCEIWIADKAPNSAELVNHQLIYTGAAYEGLLDWRADWLLIMIQFEEGTPSSYYGKNEIWKIKTDGTNLIQLTFTETNGIRTTWSNEAYDNRGTANWARFIPGEDLIYFRAHNGNGWYRSYVCNDDGTDNWYDISYPDYAFRIDMSPTGNKLLWGHATYYNNPTTLRASNVDGSGRVTIKSFSERTSFIALADGNTIIWHSNDNIYAINMDGSNERTVIDDSYAYLTWNYNPANSQELLMSSNRLDGNMHLFKINIDGSDLIQLTDTGTSQDVFPILSPNGQFLSYLRLPYDYDMQTSPQPHPSDLIIKNLTPNQEPELTNGNVSPTLGNQGTLFDFSVLYTDLNNDDPSYVTLFINETSHFMEKVIPSDNDYTDGCLYHYQSYLAPSVFNYSYYFECNDTIATNATTIFSNLKVEESNSYSPELLSANVFPFTGVNSTEFSFTVWYFDEDNNSPLNVNITIDIQTFSMIKSNPLDNIAIDGILYTYNTTLNYGFHYFQISCNDGGYTNSTGLLSGPDVHPLYGAEPVKLYQPMSFSEINDLFINFSWYSLELEFDSVNYTLEISNSSDFADPIYQITEIPESSYLTSIQVPVDLASGRHYWRVRPTYGNRSGRWSNPSHFNYFINIEGPVLILHEITPSQGNQLTTFKITAVYSDADNNVPEYVHIIIDGISYIMTQVDPLDNNYIDGSIFQYLTLLKPSDTVCTFSFECSDGDHQYSTSDYEGPIVQFDENPITPQDNNFDSVNLLVIFITLGVTLGGIIPFVVLAEISSKKMKLTDNISSKIKKKRIKF